MNPCKCGAKKKRMGQFGYCGKTDIHIKRYETDSCSSGFWVECAKCGCSTDEFNTEEQAIKAWNRRA